MIAKFPMAGTARIFDLLHRRPQVAGFVGLDFAGGHQLTGGCLKVTSQLLETRLLLPDVVPSAGMVLLAHLREVFPRLVGQLIELHRALGESLTIERNTATQHATQLFAGLEHLFEDRLALAQGRIGVDAATGG